jgi:hypothetical protein
MGKELKTINVCHPRQQSGDPVMIFYEHANNSKFQIKNYK